MKIITDTGSDILEKEALEMGICLISICACFGEETYCLNTQECFDAFYRRLRLAEELPVSSQPSPDQYLTLFEEAREQQEDVLVICVSSDLSGTYNGAVLAANISGYDRIWVVDSRQASMSQRLLVEYAVKLRDQGETAEQIAQQLQQVRSKAMLTGVPADMTYLKKGGRVSPIIASVGDVLGIKPVLWLKDGVIECRSKARGCKAARAGMQTFVKETDIDTSMPVIFAHSNNEEMGIQLMKSTQEKLGIEHAVLHEVGPAIGTHIGPDALLIAWMTK